MEKQQHRVCTIFAANGDPLFDPADGNVTCLVDSVLGLDGKMLRVTGPNHLEKSLKLSIVICCRCFGRLSVGRRCNLLCLATKRSAEKESGRQEKGKGWK